MPYILGAIILLMISNRVNAVELGTFEQARAKFDAKANCINKKTTAAMYGLGRLYGCIAGKAETVKYFINEDPRTKHTKNIKVMWNDWFVDVGYGIHADKAEAMKLIGLAASLYGPDLKDKLLAAMEQDTNVKFTRGAIDFSYTFTPGPKINERLVTISPEEIEK